MYQLADLWYSLGEARWRPHYVLTRRAVYFQRSLRRAEYWESRRSSFAGRLVLAFYKARLAMLGEKVGISIPRGTSGPGLSIAHPGGIVVNGDARIGARCRISQGVTIGATPAGAPVVGDDVFFGPNSQVIGPVMVGAGAVVLPGAVVTRDVAAGSVVGGVPAEEKSTGTEPWYRSLMIIPDRADLTGWLRERKPPA